MDEVKPGQQKKTMKYLNGLAQQWAREYGDQWIERITLHDLSHPVFNSIDNRFRTIFFIELAEEVVDPNDNEEVVQKFKERIKEENQRSETYMVVTNQTNSGLENVMSSKYAERQILFESERAKSMRVQDEELDEAYKKMERKNHLEQEIEKWENIPSANVGEELVKEKRIEGWGQEIQDIDAWFAHAEPHSADGEKRPYKSREDRGKVREIAARKWKEYPSITIARMVEDKEIGKIKKNGAPYKESTLRTWIKDLCPNRNPGRRPIIMKSKKISGGGSGKKKAS